MEHLNIRKANKVDVHKIFELIMELAIFEKGEKEVINSIEQLEQDGFGENPLYYCLIAEWNAEIVGMSLYYFRYSTWKGKRLYLEDLIVKQQFRGRGIGDALLTETLAIAKQESCSGAMWQVLDWNTPAIEFYKQKGTRIHKDWYNCNLDF